MRNHSAATEPSPDQVTKHEQAVVGEVDEVLGLEPEVAPFSVPAL
jgi:hypothetical protein